MNINISEIEINQTVLDNPNATLEDLELSFSLNFDLSFYQRIASGGKWDETPFWLKQDQQSYWVDLSYRRHAPAQLKRDIADARKQGFYSDNTNWWAS